MSKRLWLVTVASMLLGVCSAVARAQEDSYEAQRAARVDSRVDRLGTDVTDLKAAKGSGSGGNMFDWTWDNGLTAKTPDGNFKMKIGGRLQYDFGTIDQSEENMKKFGDIQNAAEVRRARLAVSGDIYSDAFFKLELDFAGGTTNPKDAWIGYKKVPLFGNIRVGHQKEPMGLDQLTSDNVISFIEPAMPIEAFTPDRNLGVVLHNTALDKKMTWAVGVFRDVDDTGTGVSDDGGAVTARVTGRPLMSEDKSKYLHLGASASYRQLPNGKTQFCTRPEWHMAPRFADTKSFMSDSVTLYGLEVAAVLGSFDVQTEVLGASTEAGDLSGWYVRAGYWITGEQKKYDEENGVFRRVSPKNNFSPGKGTWGGWQANVRYSTVDLNGDTLTGSKVNDVSLGLNWQLNPNMRIMLNGIHSMPEDEGSTSIVLGRTQIDF